VPQPPPSVKAADGAPPEAQRARRCGETRVVLFLTGLPACERAHAVKKPLAEALRPFRCLALRLGCTHEGHSRGWAHATLAGAEAAAAARAALDGLELRFCFAPGRESAARLSVDYVTDKRDTLFPFLSREQRLELRLDPTALYSVTDGVTAARTASLLAALLPLGGAGRWSVADACACAGGNALAFSAAGCDVHCAEIEPGRAAALAHNAAVARLPPPAAAFSVAAADFVHLTRPGSDWAGCSADVLFVDPPWGGTDYKQRGPLAPDALGLSGVPLAALAAAAFARGAGAAAFGTPANYDDEGLVRLLAGSEAAAAAGAAYEADRPLPFRFQFGMRMLLLLLRPQGTRLAFPTARLDDLVRAAQGWNAAHGSEHHPRFFDWEKDAWIPLSRWKGAAPVKPRAQEGAGMSGGYA